MFPGTVVQALNKSDLKSIVPTKEYHILYNWVTVDLLLADADWNFSIEKVEQRYCEMRDTTHRCKQDSHPERKEKEINNCPRSNIQIMYHGNVHLKPI